MDLSPIKTKKFRPQEGLVRLYLSGLNPRGKYNWNTRYSWSIQNYLHHVFHVLHYRSSHAPVPIQKKWRIAAKKFLDKHERIL